MQGLVMAAMGAGAAMLTACAYLEQAPSPSDTVSRAYNEMKVAEHKQKVADTAASQKANAESMATGQKQKAQSAARGRVDKAAQHASDKTAEGIGKLDKSLDSLMPK